MLLRDLKGMLYSPERAMNVPGLSELLGFVPSEVPPKVLLGEYDPRRGDLVLPAVEPNAVLLCIGWSGANQYLSYHDPKVYESFYQHYGAIWYLCNANCNSPTRPQHGVDFVLIPLEKVADAEGLKAVYYRRARAA